MYKFTCQFEILSSHSISEVSFHGENRYRLDESFSLSCPYGTRETTINFKHNDSNKGKISVTSSEFHSKDEQVIYLHSLSKLFSSLIGFKECNPHLGTPYINLDLQTFRSSITHNIDHIAFVNTQLVFNIRKKDLHVENIKKTDLLDYYCDALKAENDKSKFFHLFLIVEALEYSKEYKTMFPNGTLFSSEEKESIRGIAEPLSNDKKNALLSCLSRTKQSRAEKLFIFINDVMLKNISSKQQMELTEKIIKEIIASRNKLFHKSANLNQDLLYKVLFPLTSLIVNASINGILDLQ